MSQIYFKDELRYWMKEVNELYTKFKEAADKESDNTKKIDILNHVIMLNFIKASFKLQEIMFEKINNIESVFDKLPKTNEFDEVREEIKNVKKLAESTLLPLKQVQDEFKEIQKRGNNVYG